jgi:DnaJ domain
MSLIWTASRWLALTVALAPLRLLARLAFGAGALLMLAGAVVAPLWGIQVVISLLGGGDGGGPLPAWEMTLLLLAAIPAGLLLLCISGLLGPDSSSEPDRHNRRADREEHRDPPGHHQQHNAAHDNYHTDDDGPHGPHEPDEPDEPDEPGEPDWLDVDPVERAYLTLELEPDASLGEIKAAYRRLAHLYHPDHNPGFTRQAAQRFADIQAAYQTLTEASYEHC